MRTPPALLSRVLLAAALLFLCGMQRASATIHYVSPTGSDANDGLSWATPKATIQAAVNTCVSGDEVWVQAGTYSLIGEITTASGVLLYGGFNGSETSHDQRNPAANLTTLDGHNSTRIFYVPQNSPCTIDGFTLQNGNANSANNLAGYGGAIYLDYLASATINDDIFTNDTASYGAAISGNNNCSPIITNCTFNSDAGYGVIFLNQGGSPTISNNTFTTGSVCMGLQGVNSATITGNTVTGYTNYGINCSCGGTLVFSGNTITGNAAAAGLSSSGNMTITGNTIQNNVSSPTYGANGGMSIGANGASNTTIVVSNNIFTGNSGFSAGGLSLGRGPATFIVTNNIVHGNISTGSAGGIEFDSVINATVANNTITNNVAGSYGGGIWGINGLSYVVFKNNLIANNTAAIDGSAIYLNYTLGTQFLNNTIVYNRGAANTAAVANVYDYGMTMANNIIAFNNVGIYDAGPYTPSLIGNDVYGNTTANYNGVAPGFTDISVDPQFVNPNNADYHLATTSPVIDAGMDSYVTAGDTDLDGNARIYGPHVDLGCYEWRPTVPDIAGLSLSSSSALVGQSVTGTVTLSAPALTGGATVQLSYSAALSGPSSVTIPAGTTSAQFTLTVAASGVASISTATVSALYRGVTKTASLTVMPYLATLTLAKAAIASGTATTATITLNAPAPTGGLIVTLSSANPAAVSVPATLTLKAGAKTATFAVTAGTVSSGTAVVISAAYGAQTLSATLVVNPAGVDLRSITLNPSTLAGSQSSIGVVTLTANAPTGGILVPLTNTNPSVVTMPAFVTVPAGRNSVSFLITTSAVTTNATASISAAVVAKKTATLNVKANIITAMYLSPSPASVGDTVIGVVMIALPAPAGGLTIPLSVDLPGVLITDATVTIPAGQTIGLFYAEALTAGTAHVTANLNGALTARTLTVNP